MSEVTVTELANIVGTPVTRLLDQMKEAGLPHDSADQAVFDDDKKTLLAFLKNAHGESTAAPKKITLKRKTTGTLKAAGGQGKKTVVVEIRKKRTYVKRERPVVEESVLEEPILEETVSEEHVSEAPAKVEETELVIEAAPVADPFDPETIRQAAAERRRQEEVSEKKALIEKQKAVEPDTAAAAKIAKDKTPESKSA